MFGSSFGLNVTVLSSCRLRYYVDQQVAGVGGREVAEEAVVHIFVLVLANRRTVIGS